MIGSLETMLKGGILRPTRNLTAIKCCVQHQSVRHYPRKPRWVPMAKSKTYIFINKMPPPRMEAEEHEQIQNTYELYNRSLWAFQGIASREIEQREMMEARQVSEEVELEKMLKMNDAENERVRKIREDMLAKEWAVVEQEILEIKRQKEEEDLIKLEATEELVQKELERLKGAIKPEDLDEAIEKALAVEFDYNFAVNKQGQFLVGRHNAKEFTEGPPPNQPTIKSVGAQQ